MNLAKSQTIGKSRAVHPSGVDQITIGEMSRLFQVSLRTLRFYEDRGLLVPRRVGTTRIYAPRDKVRLELILQGKHLGFTLTEIREMLADSEKRPDAKRLSLRPDQILAQLAYLERQRLEIEDAIGQLRSAHAKLEQAQ